MTNQRTLTHELTNERLTWPTYPSLLQTQTSLRLCELRPRVGAAEGNWRPARVLRMGMRESRSGGGAAPVSSEDSVKTQEINYITQSLPSFSLALMNASSHSFFLSGVSNAMLRVSTPSLVLMLSWRKEAWLSSVACLSDTWASCLVRRSVSS